MLLPYLLAPYRLLNTIVPQANFVFAEEELNW